MSAVSTPRLGGLSIVAALGVLGPGLIALASHFDGLYGQDPYAYFDYAIGPLPQGLARASLPPFYWPPGYPLATLAASALVGPSPLAGQIVSLLSAGAAALVAGLFVLELVSLTPQTPPWTAAARTRASLAAAALVAFTPQLWQSAMVVMADAAGLAAGTSAMWLALVAARRQSRVGVALSASALAWAMLCRWAYGFIAPVWLLVLLGAFSQWSAQSTRVNADTHVSDRPVPRRRVSTTSVMSVAVVVLTIWLSPVAMTAMFGGASNVESAPAAFIGQAQVYSWSPQNAFRRSFDTVDGRLAYRLPNGLYYAAAPAHLYFFTPFAAILIAIGAWELARRRAWLTLLATLGWASSIYAFHAGAPWQNFRFTLAYLTPMAALAGVGFAAASTGPHILMRRVAIGLLALGLGGMVIGGVRLCRSFVDRKAADLATVQWIDHTTPADSALLAFGVTLTLRHYGRPATEDLFEQTTHDLERLAASGRDAYVIVDAATMEGQWRDRSPGRNFRWLRDGPGLAIVARRGDLTVFRVNH